MKGSALSFKKRAALFLMTFAVMLGGAFAAAAPAQAADSCPWGYVCWFDTSNWTGNKYVIPSGTITPGTCYNMGTDPNTNINWNDRANSAWSNFNVQSTTHVTYFGNPGCSSPNAYITKAYGNGIPGDQMKSCNQPWGIWNGPCSGTGSNRISSFKLTY